MGQTPPKYFLPSAPYGSSDAVNSVNAVQPMAINPQTPLLPPNFTDPGKGATQQARQSPFSPIAGGGGQSDIWRQVLNQLK